jgi:hypothetical protein
MSSSGPQCRDPGTVWTGSADALHCGRIAADDTAHLCSWCQGKPRAQLATGAATKLVKARHVHLKPVPQSSAIGGTTIRRTCMTLRFAPPPRFPIYGINNPDPTQCALDWVHVYTRGGRSATYGIWLVHLTATGGIRLGSFDSVILGAMCDNPAQAAAQHGTNALIDLTLPTRNRSIAPIVARRVKAHAPPNEHWDVSAWEIDGTKTLAKTWSFANGWTGIADRRDTYLCAVGTGPAPEALHLQQLLTTTIYGFDHNAPIDRRHHFGEQRVWHESLITPPNSDLHEDHRQLIDQHD